MKQNNQIPYVHDWQKAHILKENKLIQNKYSKKSDSKKAEEAK